MNTPEPCDTCDNLYYDIFSKDDPGYSIECKVECIIGTHNCFNYKKYKSVQETGGSKEGSK